MKAVLFGMKDFLRELRPLLILFGTGVLFTLLAVLATGKRAVSADPGIYWDGREMDSGVVVELLE